MSTPYITNRLCLRPTLMDFEYECYLLQQQYFLFNGSMFKSLKNT